MFDSPAVKGVASASVRKCLAEVTVPDNAKNTLLENPATEAAGKVRGSAVLP